MFYFVRSPTSYRPRSTRLPDAFLRGVSPALSIRCNRPSTENCDGDMTAADTNVLIRLLTGDDLAQAAAARSSFESGQIWIAKTVLLETAWVLQSLYEFDDRAIRGALTKLLGLRNVSVEEASAVASALALTAEGIEFANALHLNSRPEGAAFVSFDKAFVKRATRAGVSGVRRVVDSK